MNYTEEQIQAQRDIAARVATKLNPTEEPIFAHIGFLRRSRRAKPSTLGLGLRFYPTPDLLGEALEDGGVWESIETVRVA